MRPNPENRFTFYSTGVEPTIVVAVDAVTPTAVKALLAPLNHLSSVGLLLLSTVKLPSEISSGWSEVAHELNYQDSLNKLSQSRSLILSYSAGHFLPAGALVHQFGQIHNLISVISQHGLLTPFAPPLPEGAHLLAFSEEDAQFWKSGRTDVSSEVVGAQLVWDAQHKGKRELTTDEPLFLGQLHGAEISRSVSSTTAKKFCRETGAIYRPHPSETDILSRIQHSMWERQGINIDRSRKPLLEEPRPVVSIFSTGVIEAAAAGIPSWVMCNKPISWVEHFWERYSMSKWGSDPTPPPPQLKQEPALAIASSLQRIMGTTK